jgi:cysteine-rich repeat protein
MRTTAIGVGAMLGFLMACAPEAPDLDIGAGSAHHGGAAGSERREGGVRILSDVALPPEVDGGRARGGAGGGGAPDATTADRVHDDAEREDATAVPDAGNDMNASLDAKGIDAPRPAVDAPGDARVRMDAARFDAVDAIDAADARRGNDAAHPIDATIALGTCAAVRACVRERRTEAACLAMASAAARSSAEPVLVCEIADCAVPCRTTYVMVDCNACLLKGCSAALVGCARQSGCGDGISASDTEECDDGNAGDRDACTAACTRARCGDGFTYDVQEECDDGNQVDTDACRISCRRATCGDGVIWTGVEGCDDGNRTGGDGCSAACLIESCGNGVVDPREECDEAAANRDDAPCLPTCRANRCGDAKICKSEGCGAQLGTALEQCDDGNDADDDACVKGCRAALCGDGYVQRSVEACDDGNADPFDACGKCLPSAGHLLITEVVTRPAGAEMLEIWNPTRFAIALSDYVISDSHLYYEIASGSFSTSSGSDFAARFPDGAMLEAGRYAVVALGNASGGVQSFAATYGKAPDFELRPTANQAADDASVPNMVAAAGASIGANASLTDGGEPVVLFSYRGGDHVSDVDYVFYGAASASNQMVDKTGVVAGAFTYLADTPADAQHTVAAPGETGSIHRCVYAESHESAAQGNGITGHDETSEDVTTAFAVATSAALRTPGGPPPANLCPP